MNLLDRYEGKRSNMAEAEQLSPFRSLIVIIQNTILDRDKPFWQNKAKMRNHFNARLLGRPRGQSWISTSTAWVTRFRTTLWPTLRCRG
jgi:hypothetical protein